MERDIFRSSKVDPKYPRGPRGKLSEARDRYNLLRRNILFATSMAVWGQDAQKVAQGINTWDIFVREETRIARYDISPAKKKLKQPVTDRSVEAKVVENLKAFGEILGEAIGIPGEFREAFSEGTALARIESTKDIQREEGVLDDEEPNDEKISFNAGAKLDYIKIT